MLRDAGNYYKGNGDYYGKYKTNPIQLSCQPNFIILMSDGLRNGQLDPVPQATTLYTSDYAPSLPGAQNVMVDAVGFAVSPGEEADNGVLQNVPTNGGGTFYSTNDQATDRSNLINFIRRMDSYNWYGSNATADRPWKLGDIFHSTPVLVTPPLTPTPPTDDGSYAASKAANATRTTILVAGANDGMLHAFRESDGVELWAFIPPDLLDNLQQLTVSGGQHPFLVDGSPVAADVKIGGSWKTVVIFGERRGGNVYTALDITDTTNPPYLWNFTHSEMVQTWSTPAVGQVQMADGTPKYVAFVGGGFDASSSNSAGRAVYAIDIATGAKLWEYNHTAGATDDRKYMNFSIPADVTAADLTEHGWLHRPPLRRGRGRAGLEVRPVGPGDPFLRSGQQLDGEAVVHRGCHHGQPAEQSPGELGVLPDPGHPRCDHPGL